LLTREERFDALTAADTEALVAMADELLSTHEVTVLRAPAGAAVMMRAIETAEGSTFNLGEVSVTEAEVELAGERGYCMVLGFNPEKALAGAVLDAAAEGRLDSAGEIERLLLGALENRRLAQLAEWNRLAPTRVQFDEIPG